MKFVYHDGGRAEAGYKGDVRDCVTRAIAIIEGKSYNEIYNTINTLCEDRIIKNKKSSAKTGVMKPIYHKYLLSIGYKWIPTMLIGQGCKVHLESNELPKGRLIVRVSKHLAAVIDGVLYDNHDCTRDGNRCVYGYYVKNVL